MKKLIFLVGVAAAGYFIVWPRVGPKIMSEINPSYTQEASRRVNQVLMGMQGTSDPKFGPPDQYALSMWSENKIMLDRDAMDLASPHFDAFRRHEHIYRKIGQYEILEVTDTSTQDAKCALVKLRIDGSRYSWLVPERGAISGAPAAD